MDKVVQVPCPGCKRVLRVPAHMADQKFKCKHCGTVLGGRPKPKEDDPHTSPTRQRGRPEPDPEPEPDAPIIRSVPRRQSRGPRWLKPLVSLVVLAVALTAGALLWGPFQRFLDQVEERPETAGKPDKDQRPSGPTTGPATFPRRALAVSINNYLYANPVGAGGPSANVKGLMERLARTLPIDRAQAVAWSDVAEGDAGKGAIRPMPTRANVEHTLTRFLESGRPHDRILLLFIGHAVVLEGAAYLAPWDGDLTVKDSLLPLSWLYDKLQAAPGHQKTLILDVCRLDPGRGTERPAPGPMSPELDAAIKKAPDKVQVWTACSAGEYSYEFDGQCVFLSKLFEAVDQARGKLTSEPDAPLPIETLARTVSARTTEEVKNRTGQAQTPQLFGKPPADPAPPAADERPAPPVEIVAAPAARPGQADRPLVEAIVKEVELPPVRLSSQEAYAPVPVEDAGPYTQKALAGYEPSDSPKNNRDPAKHPLRAAVLQAVDQMRQEARVQLQGELTGSVNETVKTRTYKHQEELALVIGRLNGVVEQLREAGKDRQKEPSKRWQAHYDYALAQALLRSAYLSEHSLLLGKIRKDELPALEPGQTGYRIVVRDKMQSGKEFRDQVAEAHQLFDKLVKEHPATPWEVLARRAKLLHVGLDWITVK